MDLAVRQALPDAVGERPTKSRASFRAMKSMTRRPKSSFASLSPSCACVSFPQNQPVLLTYLLPSSDDPSLSASWRKTVSPRITC